MRLNTFVWVIESPKQIVIKPFSYEELMSWKRPIPQNGHHHCSGLARLSTTALYGVSFPHFTTHDQRKSA
jgi:hypothetical protein